MKKLFLSLTILFVISPLYVISAPNYDPNHKGCVYDDSANRELFNRLKNEYDKKCWVKLSDTHYTNTCGVNSYDAMVMVPYFQQMQRFNFDTCEVIKE